MDAKLHTAIGKLHLNGYDKVVAAATGAGAGIQDLLAKVSGASATLLDAVFPYDTLALTDFLDGVVPTQACSEDTGLALAARAYHRARELCIRKGLRPDQAIGLGLTAAITTNRPKKGALRAFAALVSDEITLSTEVVFPKNETGYGILGREEEGRICDLITLNLLFKGTNVDYELELPTDVKPITRIVPPLAIEAKDFWSRPLFFADGRRDTALALDPSKHVLFPGSFNPLHQGHLSLARELRIAHGFEVVYLVSGSHPDKGALDIQAINRRAQQFRLLAPVLFTPTSGLFIEKARQFPGLWYVIGNDTFERLLDPKYYNTSVIDMLSSIRDLGSGFYIAGRSIDGKYRTVLDVIKAHDIPASLWDMIVPLGSNTNVASRDIRAIAS